MSRIAVLGCLAALLLLADPKPAAAQAAPVSPADHILLTVILKQDQSRPVDRLVEEARANGFYAQFPPPGIEVASWVNVIGLGQVVVLKVPPARLREVNVTLERTAWGPYRTEVYAAYDFMEPARRLHAEAFAKVRP